MEYSSRNMTSRYANPQERAPERQNGSRMEAAVMEAYRNRDFPAILTAASKFLDEAYDEKGDLKAGYNTEYLPRAWSYAAAAFEADGRRDYAYHCLRAADTYGVLDSENSGGVAEGLKRYELDFGVIRYQDGTSVGEPHPGINMLNALPDMRCRRPDLVNPAEVKQPQRYLPVTRSSVIGALLKLLQNKA
ncbi:Uncharacterised protein [uncultured archaeon]|nr:Uncharacterised protein [uncultured archaeon]